MGVQPFLYAALLIETVVLISIPMLSPQGKKPQPGVLRYLTLQTMAMPFILLAGELLTGVEALPPDSPLVFQSALILGLGIGLWLAVFPFHSWVPMVAEHSNPLAASFLFSIVPTTVLVFSLNFLNRYTFLRETAEIFTALQTIGVIIIVVSGIWTAIQTNLKRAFSFSILNETGVSLLAIGLAAQGGLGWMLMLFPARMLSYWLWGMILTKMEQEENVLELSQLHGFARRNPLLAGGLLLAQFSVAGMPLLAEFPIKLRLLSAAYETQASLGIWGFIGSLGLFLFTIRVITGFVSPSETRPGKSWSFSEQTGQTILIGVAVLALLLLGLFPHIFLSRITQILVTFGQLQ